MKKRLLIAPLMLSLLVSCSSNPTSNETSTSGDDATTSIDGNTTTNPSTEPTIFAGIKIEGKVNAIFEKVTDTLYVAKGVEVLEKSNINFKNSLQATTLTYTGKDINREKCNAAWDYAPSSYKEEYTVVIEGGAKYDFFCDLTDAKPISIRRTEVTALPNSASTLRNLFPSLVGNVSLCNVEGDNQITFTDKIEKSIVSFTNYESNKSFTKLSNIETPNEVKEMIYRSLDGNVLKEIDTFKGDSTKKDFARTYKVVDEIPADHVRNTKLQTEAANYVEESYYNQFTFGNIILESYGYGFETENNELTIKSDKKEDGSFVTTVESKKEGDDTYYVYLNKAVLEFGKDGVLKKGTFTKNSFTSAVYNFTAHKFNEGYESTAVLKADVEFKANFVEKSKEKLIFDETPYFVSKIKEITLQDAGCVPEGETGNFVQQGNKLVFFSETNPLYKFDFAPSTALDTQDYSIIDSSDKNVIAEETDYNFTAKNVGVAEVTVGNGTTNSVTAKSKVTVVNKVPLRSFYMDLRGDSDDFGAEYAYIPAGDIIVAPIAATPSKAPKNFVPVASTTDYANVTVTEDNRLVIDTTKSKSLYAGEELVFKITMNSPNYGEGQKPTVFTIHITQEWNQGLFVGQWKAIYDNDYFEFRNDGTGSFFLNNYYDSAAELKFKWKKKSNYVYSIDCEELTVGTDVHTYQIVLLYSPHFQTLRFSLTDGVYGSSSPTPIYGGDFEYSNLKKVS